MASASKLTPYTYGELRKLLADAGAPWQPDPTKSNEEPLPVFPTGGDGVYEPHSRTIGRGGVDDLLKSATSPSNPDVRAEWSEAGLLADEVTETRRATRPSRKRMSTTPAPDSGG